MKRNSVFLRLFALLMITGMAQLGSNSALADQAFWVRYWAQPKAILYGAEEEAFYQNIKAIQFARNEFDRCLNPGDLEGNARWLKEHPNARFFIDAYASARGGQDYNLVLSQRRADWVKNELISRGVPAQQVRLAVGWGEIYLSCLEDSEECRASSKAARPPHL